MNLLGSVGLWLSFGGVRVGGPPGLTEKPTQPFKFSVLGAILQLLNTKHNNSIFATAKLLLKRLS